jgi:hypothetical protein
MRAVSGSYLKKGGFIFECPRCKHKIAVAFMADRFSEKVEVVKPEPRRKKKISTT